MVQNHIFCCVGSYGNVKIIDSLDLKFNWFPALQGSLFGGCWGNWLTSLCCKLTYFHQYLLCCSCTNPCSVLFVVVARHVKVVTF